MPSMWVRFPPTNTNASLVKRYNNGFVIRGWQFDSVKKHRDDSPHRVDNPVKLSGGVVAKHPIKYGHTQLHIAD
jgi:hypothetical protein